MEVLAPIITSGAECAGEGVEVDEGGAGGAGGAVSGEGELGVSLRSGVSDHELGPESETGVQAGIRESGECGVGVSGKGGGEGEEVVQEGEEERRGLTFDKENETEVAAGVLLSSGSVLGLGSRPTEPGGAVGDVCITHGVQWLDFLDEVEVADDEDDGCQPSLLSCSLLSLPPLPPRHSPSLAPFLARSLARSLVRSLSIR